MINANNEIGNRIKILMQKENITTQLLADEIGITVGGLNHILTGRNSPRYDLLVKIVNRYSNINLDWLILGNLPIYKKEKTILSSPTKSTSFDVNSNNLLTLEKMNKVKNKINESEKLFLEQSSEIQSFMKKTNISESIEEIRVYFKDKTYLILKPEK